jgi:hypothetical protein
MDEKKRSWRGRKNEEIEYCTGNRARAIPVISEQS